MELFIIDLHLIMTVITITDNFWVVGSKWVIGGLGTWGAGR